MNSENQGVSDASIEREIQAKGLTAPRLRPSDLDANIAHTDIVKHISKSGQVLRWAVLTTLNGFAVTGKPSASVSPENDDAEIGEKVAFDNARAELWPLMGYALKERMHLMEKFPCEKGVVMGVTIITNAPATPPIPAHQQRVIDEKRELDDKLVKLRTFIDGSPVFSGLPVTDQSHLKSQLAVMEVYSCILADRIARFGGAA